MGLTIIDNNNIFQKDVIGKVRTAQEDSHDIAALTPNGDVFVVCDGMGGHVGGKQASSIAVKSIIEYLKKERYSDPAQALNDALQFANMQILGYANQHPEFRGMGTTACIVLLQEAEAYIAHVGDSRIYLYLGKEKQLHRITKDHSFVQTLVDAGQITEEEAEHHPDKNRILRALGIKQDLVPSFDKVKPKNGDIFLICSDGLSGMIPDSTIKDVMMQNRSIEGKGETLINLALEGGGVDNITVELVQIVNSPCTKSIFRSYNPTSNNISRRKFKKFKQTMIAICTIVICITVGYSFYWTHQSAKYKKNIRDLSDEIQQDSIALIQAEKEFKRDSIAWRQSASTTKAVRIQWEKDKTEYNKKAYDLAVKATEALKSNVESKREVLNQAIDSLSEKQQIRERLINQKKKQ